jgi:antitoxin (DNA-binding transcriptional repressor) of toxin-antitoxin stability system
MKEISIEDLRRNAAEWVKLAADQETIVITDGGKRVATLTGLDSPHRSRPLPDREEKIRRRSQITVDSADYLSEMRD